MQDKLLSEINQVLENEIAQRHSYFQLKYFVIGKEPTNQAKMWQCLRELRSRYDSLESINLEIEETKDKLEILDISIEKMQQPCPSSYDNLSKREAAVRMRQAERKKIATQNSLDQLYDRQKWLMEESRFFLETFKNLEKIEPLKNFDDIDAQKEYWSEKLSQKLNLKMLTHNQLDTELIETIISLPDELPIKKQALQTLGLRHTAMVKQLKDTMNHIEKQENQ